MPPVLVSRGTGGFAASVARHTLDGMTEIPATVRVQQTTDLRLRPLTMDDLDRVHLWSSDPRSFTHAPFARHTSTDQTRRALEVWVRAWREGGPSYWMAERRTDGMPLGYGGVRRTPDGINLAYRVDVEHHGHGYGTQIAAVAATLGIEWCSGDEVYALIRPANLASRRTAERAGLWMTDEQPDEVDLPAGEAPSRVLRLPRFITGDDGLRPGAREYDELLDLWCRVNAAGGAVGFEGATPRQDVAATLDGHLGRCRSGHGVVGRLLHPVSGELLGAAFWQLFDHPKYAHVGELQRVMVDPAHRRRNLGRLLVGGMHAAARACGVEIARLNYRGGTGVAPFYETCGYTEIGRLPGGLRLKEGYVDDVEMARRLDGVPW